MSSSPVRDGAGRSHAVRELTAFRRSVAALAFIVASLAAWGASARQRMVVVIVAGDDQTLADNLTEVAIAKLAETGDYQLIGFRELRGRLAEIPGGAGWDACVVAPACLDRLLTGAAATAAVVGVVHKDDQGFRLRLTLEAPGETGRAVPLQRTTPPDVALLVDAVLQGVGQLFAPAPLAATAPVASPPAAPAPVLVAAPRAPELVTPPAPARAPSYLPYAGYAATVLAAIALSGAAVAGELAVASPTRSTRAPIQADLGRRHRYATTPNRLPPPGGAPALTAAAASVWDAMTGPPP